MITEAKQKKNPKNHAFVLFSCSFLFAEAQRAEILYGLKDSFLANLTLLC